MMNNKIAGYRRMINKNQSEMAKEFGISTQAYSAKETGITQFKDSEKVIFKEMLKPVFPDIKIDDIFF